MGIVSRLFSLPAFGFFMLLAGCSTSSQPDLIQTLPAYTNQAAPAVAPSPPKPIKPPQTCTQAAYDAAGGLSNGLRHWRVYVPSRNLGVLKDTFKFMTYSQLSLQQWEALGCYDGASQSAELRRAFHSMLESIGVGFVSSGRPDLTCHNLWVNAREGYAAAQALQGERVEKTFMTGYIGIAQGLRQYGDCVIAAPRRQPPRQPNSRPQQTI